MVLQGTLSAKTAQKIAAASCRDGNAHPEMQFLANLGSGGQYGNKCWQQLSDKLGLDNCCFPEPLKILVPVRDLKARPVQTIWVNWEIMLLQDICNALYHNNKAEFDRRFLGGDASRIPAYWAQVRQDDPRISEHPVKNLENWQERAIPGRLHGDDVPFGKGRLASLDCISVSSLLAVGAVLDFVNLYFAFPKQILCKKEAHGEDTMDHLWKVAIWDLMTVVHYLALE